MKNILIIFLLVAALTGKAQSHFVDKTSALDIAAKEFALSRNFDSKSFNQLQPELKFTGVQNDTVTYYVVGFRGQAGLVFLSACELTLPVIGVTNESKFDINNIPDGLRWLLGKHQERIIHMLRSEARNPGSVPREEEWKTIRDLYGPKGEISQRHFGFFDTIGPLVTAKWSQRWPYNLHCPRMDYLVTTCKTIAGCGPIAMAQVMHYNKFPDRYDWSQMPDQLTSENHEVARLVLDAGRAAKTNHGCSFSETWPWKIDDALKNIFGYPTARYDDDIDDDGRHEDFILKIRDQISDGFPVIVDGYEEWNIADWHLFVLDGFLGPPNRIGRFHINWGWGGSYDGWYRLDICDPPGSNGPYNYNQGVIHQIIPWGRVNMVLPESLSTVYSYNDVFIGWQTGGRAADFDSAMIQLLIPKYKSKDTLDPDNTVTIRVANQPGNNYIVFQFDTPGISSKDSVSVDARITVFRTVNGKHTQRYHSDWQRFYLRDGEDVDFVNPDAGTVWQANMPVTIDWAYNTNVHSNVMPEFKIKYSKVSGPGSNWGMIASNAQDSSVDWLIPPGLEGVYRIEGHYSGDTEKWFQTEAFSITQHPILSISIPGVAAHYEPGKDLNITWQSNLAENVRIKLSRFDDVNAADTIIIAGSAPNTGSYIWPIPEDINPGTLYALEITGVVNTHISAAIAFFTIKKKLSLLNPQGGVEWENGKTQYITWLDQYPGNVKISLYKAGVFHSNIVLDTENDGVYAWHVPPGLTPSPAYQIRISKVDDDAVFSMSEYFSIVEAYFIELLKPEPNMHWQKGEAYYIKWNENVPNAFIIELLDYTVWPPAVTLIHNYTFQGVNGYLWTVPNTLDAHGLYKIRVTSFQYPEVSGTSEYFNIINGPEINVQVPNDTTSWPTASSQQILYSDNLNGTVSIHLYNRSASPGFIATLASNVPSTGSFTWSIPPLYTPADDYYIIVRSDDFPTVQSVSDDFELTQGQFIQLYTPELGDEWEVGTTQFITWNTNMAPQAQVVIHLVRPAAGFSLKIHNTASVQNSGFYAWTIPTDLPPATNYHINIRIWNFPHINDRSKAFSITNQAGNYLSVISPSQGDSWKIGTVQTVSWDHNYSSDWFTWRFYKGDTPTSANGNVIGSSVPVTVPASLEPGDDYRIKIARYFNPETYDFSEEFEILPADFIHYTGPLVMRMNDTVLLTWNDNIDEHVSIELMHADTVFHTIASSVESNGSYLWAIPTHFLIEQWFKIRISNVNNPALFALSNNVQIKFAHFVSLFAPDASILSIDGSHLIEWTHNFPGGYSGEPFSIDLYKDDEYVSWIHPGALMDVHQWIPTSFNVPEPGENYSIKISSTSKPQVFDFSEYFTLIDCDSIPPFSLGPDTVLYLDSEIVIFAPDGFQSYQWEPYYLNQSRFLRISGQSLNGPGVLEIICHATYAGGCFISDTILINVLYPPCYASASFTYMQTNGSDMCNSFLFMCLSDTTMNHNVEWDFGDGTIVDTTAMIVEHEYANAGSYLVKCKVYHPQFTQCFEEYSEIVHVSIPPEISLSHWVSVDTAWVVPVIQGSGEYRVKWYIDDKLVESMKLDTLYNDTLMYVFPKNDTYPVSAHVFDSLSPHCSFVGSTSIAINDIPPCRSTTGYFSYRPLDGYGSGVRNKFQFWAGVNINLDCYEITWNMGDGKPEFTDSLDFTYKFNPGTYVVTMTLQNCDTCIFILTDTINAFLPLDAGLPDLAEACDSTVLYANPDLAAWEWSDSTYNSWLPVYQSGEYRVLVVDGYGYYIYDTAQVFIHPSPEVGFDEMPIICSDESFIILTQGTPSGGTYAGNFVEGNIFNVEDAGPGFHEVTYYFEDINGCGSVAHAILEVEATHSGNLYLQNHVVSGNFYLTGDSIVSGSHITDSQSYGPWVVEDGADVYLKADKNIIMKPGTVIKSGSQLRAIILPLNCLELDKKDLHAKTNDFEYSTKVFLAPNPTNGQTYIWTDSGTLEGFTLEVFDSKGITLIKTNDMHSSKTIINLTAYPPGLYFVRLVDGKSLHSIKLIRN